MLRVFKLKENDPLLWTQKLKNFEVQIKGYNLAFQAIVVQAVVTVSESPNLLQFKGNSNENLHEKMFSLHKGNLDGSLKFFPTRG